MICTKIFLSLGLVAPILAQSNYTFPDGFDLSQVESTEKSMYPSFVYVSQEGC